MDTDPTLSSVSIVDGNTGYATEDDTITLTFTTSETINTPTVVFYHSGVEVEHMIIRLRMIIVII